MNIDDEETQDVDIYDPVASRAQSFARILATIDTVQDDDARKEALLMLRALRMSFKTLPVGDLSALPGGKSS